MKYILITVACLLIQQINEGSYNNTNYIQRNNDGNYTTDKSTPGQRNDRGGIPKLKIQPQPPDKNSARSKAKFPAPDIPLPVS